MLPFWDWRARLASPAMLAHLLPVAAAILAISVCVTGIQTRFYPKPLKLNFQLFNPPFGTASQALNALALPVAKIACIACAFYYLVQARIIEVVKYAQLNTTSLYQVVDYILSPFLYAMVLCSVVIGIADYFWKYLQNKQKLRMSKYEVRREMIEQEGNPTIKFKRKQFHEKLARRPSLSEATLVVTNPTHFAVALYWDGTDMPPVVIDKAEGDVASFVAQVNGAPVVRVPTVARGLCQDVGSGEYITEKYYDSVAKILTDVITDTK